MRHRVGFKDLSRSSAERKALLRGLVTSLLKYEVIQTTEAKAKEARRIAEKIITRAKNANKTINELTAKGSDEAILAAKGVNVHAHRMIAKTLYSEEVVAKVFTELAPRYEKRVGGYTRILKLGYRQGDAAPVVQLSLVDHPERKFEKKSKDEKQKSPKAKKPSLFGRSKKDNVKKDKGSVSSTSSSRKVMNSNKSV